ncbi:MAG TPA: DegT/DnrJ/EryC1/StrS family aminotransferase, partial [Negativicutes bacterium]|nr:DegT/DnrJ/EryC1/StrS family aminotransferase [Negativicutes bacterium]
VLTPALTFVATANAVSHAGGIPHFVDSEERTLGLDPHKLAAYLLETAAVKSDGCYNKATGRRIKAAMPMHTFGHPVDLDPLIELCGRYKIVLVEDAAESLGSYYKGVHTGKFGLISALSFNGNKVVTTGGGGAILTDDEELGRLAKHITTTAKLPHKWAFHHDMVAYNYRLPNINAALGCAQMEQLPGFIARKRALAARYRQALAAVPGVSFFSEQPFAESNYWLNALLLDEPDMAARDGLMAMCHEAGLMVRPAWTLMHRLPMYAACPRMDLSVDENIEARLVNLPSSVFLSEQQA